jgi:F-type H+-transporting ATPase subunit epsilon
MALKLEIVTPEAKVFSGEVSTVVLPGQLGEMGVLPNHAPLVTALLPGELRYTEGNTITELAVGAGFVEVGEHGVKVLTDLAVADAHIDENTVQAALDAAQARLKDASANNLGAEEIAAVEASILNSLAQLKLKRKRRTL